MKRCFIIMPFGGKFNDYYNLILKPTVLELGFEVIRADEIYDNQSIIDSLYENILEADLIIADVSGKNPNVNYELGVAHALSKKVIIISQRVDDIPFDYKHLRCIIYDTKNVNWQSSLQKTLIRYIESPKTECFTSLNLSEFYSQESRKRLYGLSNVFSSRQEMNIFLQDSWNTKVSSLDIIAFGLKSFRDSMTTEVKKQLLGGLKIRILTLYPNSIFLNEREKLENLVEGSITKTIINLVEWINDCNNSIKKINIEVKFYDSLPLDFYWKQDYNVFVGPYLKGIGSQQTLTYLYNQESQIGRFYCDYFESLWNNNQFSKTIIL